MFEATQSDIERIDRDSLRILQELGVRVDDDKLRQAATRAGATRGRDAETICLPPEMVREHVAMAPSQVAFADCDGAATHVGAGAPATFWTGAALNYVVAGRRRAITSDDLRDFARIAETIDTLTALVGTSVADAPPPVRDVAGLAIMAANTRKHLRPLLFDAAGVPAMIEIAEIVADGASLADRPLLSFGYSCLPPLHWSKISSDLWRASSGRGIPLMINGEPITGTTSPVTLAGSLALANAEVLAGVVLIQLLEPGRPVVHNVGFAHSVEMRTAACLSGSPECALLAAAGAKLARFYELPSASWMCTDAFDDDEQASMEKMLTGFAHVAAGVDVIWGMGQLESEKTLSPVQLVMDDEVAAALQRYDRGFAVSDDTLAYDVIREVIAGGEEFLAHEHTLMNFRTVLSESPLLARTNRDAWRASGASTLAERAAARVDQILAAEPTPLLSDTQLRDIEAIRQRELARIG